MHVAQQVIHFQALLQTDTDEALDIFYEQSDPSTVRELFYEANSHNLLLPALYSWLDGWSDHYTTIPSKAVVKLRGKMVVRSIASLNLFHLYRDVLVDIVPLLGEEAMTMYPFYRKQLEDEFSIAF